MTTFKAIRVCVFCGDRFHGQAVEDERWTFQQLDGNQYYRCGTCTEQGRVEPRKVELKHEWFWDTRTVEFQDRSA
jgi:hypothetical protein